MLKAGGSKARAHERKLLAATKREVKDVIALRAPEPEGRPRGDMHTQNLTGARSAH